MRNSIRHLYNSEKVTLGELLLKARRNEDEEILAKVTSKSSVMETEVKGELNKQVDMLLAVEKLGKMGNRKDKRDRNQTAKSTLPIQGNGQQLKGIVSKTLGIVSKAQE